MSVNEYDNWRLILHSFISPQKCDIKKQYEKQNLTELV